MNLVQPKMKLTHKQLGDDAEDHTCRLLEAKGYATTKLPVNHPTYDIVATRSDSRFLVSVKVSRQKQHVRLGARKSVLALDIGNFVFAYVAEPGREIETLGSSTHSLLILPAEQVRVDSLAIHDAYWLARDRDPSIFSVIVKAYDRYGCPVWSSWQTYREAWHLLP